MFSMTDSELSGGNPREERLILALLVVAVIAAYGRALFFPYVFDDTAIIRGNPDIRGWSSLWTLWTKPYWNGSGDAGFYRPVFVALLSLVWNAGARVPFWYHLTAVALHTTVTVVVWRMLRRVLPTVPAALRSEEHTSEL